MSVVHLVLLILGVALVVVGVIRIAHQAFIDGIIVAAVGLLLLGLGGYINA